MPLVQGTYQPSAFNPLLVPVSDAPPVDTDPYSPTYGQPTFSNLRPRANTPDVGTTAKGNPGQPGANVPTTAAPNAAPQLPNVDATFTMEPAGPPKAQAKTPAKAATKPAEEEVPDYLGNAKPQVDERGKPPQQAQPAPTQPVPTDGDVPDYLGNAKPQVDTHGQPATPAYTGQEMWSAKSPGATAIGPVPMAPLEGFVPGADVQAAINTAQEPGQRAAIAASQLKIPLDRIIVNASPGGRMAAVGDNGVPYYIEPQPFFTDQGGYTKATGDQRYASGPNLWQRLFGAPGAGETEPRDPGGPTDQGPISRIPWERTTAASPSPYSRAMPFREGPFGGALPNPATDLAPNIGGAIPSAIQNALTYGPALAVETVGTPALGALTAGGMNYVTSTGRQLIANALTSNKDYQQPVYTKDRAKDAALAAALWYAPTRVGRTLGLMPNQLPWAGTPVAAVPSTYAEHPMVGQQQLPGDMFGRPTYGPPPRNPLLPPPPEAPPSLPAAPVTPPAAPAGSPNQPTLPLEGAPTPPTGEVSGIPPRPAPATPAEPAAPVHDPFEGTGEQSGPYAPVTSQEEAAQPTRLPPPRMPILTRQGVENRADEIIRHFATGGNTALDERDLITPAGLPQRTGNGGLAALWRYMATSTPEGVNLIQNFKDRALAMRQAFTRNLVGTQEDLNAARGERLGNTRQAYRQAFGEGQTTPVDAQPVVDQINTILQSPEGLRSDIAQPLRQIRDMFYERDPLTGQLPTDADGNPIRTLITDPERLYNVRRDINDSLRGPAATSTLPNARAAGHVMGDVLNNLDQTIASGAPNYPTYMQQYANASRGINAMEFLQGRNLTDANGNTTLAKVDGAIKEAERQRGVDPRRRPADSLTDDQMSQLYTLRDDLRRQANETKGKALGSDTAQNFATSSIANNLVMPAVRMAMRTGAAHLGGVSGNPLLELPMMLGEGAAERLLGGGETGAAAVRRAIIRRLLNEDGSGTRALGAPVGPPPPPGGL